MTSIREQCGCGSAIRIDHSDNPAAIAADWRSSHPCDRRPASERDIAAGAAIETVYTEPHRTDSDLHTRPGFGRRRADTEPLELLEGGHR